MSTEGVVQCEWRSNARRCASIIQRCGQSWEGESQSSSSSDGRSLRVESTPQAPSNERSAAIRASIRPPSTSRVGRNGGLDAIRRAVVSAPCDGLCCRHGGTAPSVSITASAFAFHRPAGGTTSRIRMQQKANSERMGRRFRIIDSSRFRPAALGSIRLRPPASTRRSEAAPLNIHHCPCRRQSPTACNYHGRALRIERASESGSMDCSAWGRGA